MFRPALTQIKNPGGTPYQKVWMATFLYKCPVTGHNVQGFSEGGVKQGADVHEAVVCLACRQTHLVNPATGAVLGAKDRPPRGR